MKEGLKVGCKAEYEVLVTEKMTVKFPDRPPHHPFYSTYSACYHAEFVSRLVLEPFLEDDEDGIGSGLTLKHSAPALVGQTIKIVAVATRVRSHHLSTDFEITQNGRVIAHGEVHQVILLKSQIDAMENQPIK